MRKILSFFALCFICLSQSAFAQETKNMKKPVIVFETSLGAIELTLMPDVAPKACQNILGLIEKKYYDGIIFHRVINQFMIQGGDPTATGRGGQSLWGKPFENECKPNVKFDRPGLLGMANAGPNTNGSQFFITTVPTPWLNNMHTIFAEVTSGMDVVRAIEKTKTNQDRPITDIRIVKAYVKQ